MSSQSLNDVHVEKARNILSALPRMSKDIIDDTIYEKVLSFLSSFLKSEDHGVQMYDSWNVLGILTMTCVSSDQDPRIKAVCLRFLGKLIAHDSHPNSSLFAKLVSSHQALLEQLEVCSVAPEGALRVAATEACHGFIRNPEGLEWLASNDTMKHNLLKNLKDTNNYLVSTTCRFYSTLINNCYSDELYKPLSKASKKLFNMIDPTPYIHQMLTNGGHSTLTDTTQPGKWAALEYCWTIASTQSMAMLGYLQETRILEPIFSNVHDNNRLIRNRNVEILSAVFEWAPQPMKLFYNMSKSDNSETTAVMEAYNALVSKGMQLLDTDRFECAVTGMHLIKISLILAKRLPPARAIPGVQALCTLMLELLQLCMRKEVDPGSSSHLNLARLQTHLWASQRAASNRKLLMISVFKTLHIVTHDFQDAIAKVNPLETTLNLLESQGMATDLRVLKPLLSQLSPLLATVKHGHNQDFAAMAPDHGINKTLSTLIRLLEDSRMDGRAVKLILQTFDSFLSNSELSDFMLQKDISRSVAQALTLRLYDTEWDTRDTAVAFIGNLYEPPYIPAKIEFAQKNNLALEVVHKIVDGEAYVRSAALDAIQSMMNNASGWIFIKNNELTKHINAKLPPLIHDPEALVRRAALDSMSCLLHNQSYEGLFDQQGLSQSDMTMLIDDTDWEVRLRACNLLHELWKADRQLRGRSKKGYSDNIEFKPQFYQLGGDRLLLLSTQDSARLVREKAMNVLKSIRAQLKPENASGYETNTKRALALEEEDQGFADAIEKIEFERLAATVSAEHMYEETFDIDYSGVDIASMTESLRDTNMLDCE